MGRYIRTSTTAFSSLGWAVASWGVHFVMMSYNLHMYYISHRISHTSNKNVNGKKHTVYYETKRNVFP